MTFSGWFKNLTVFRFTDPCTLDPDSLAVALSRSRFRACGSQELVTRGWVPPLGGEDGALAHAAGGFWLVCLQTEEKVLPAEVIGDALEARVREIEDREARKVRRKEKEILRDEVLLDLLPRAFTRRKRLYAYLDPRGGWLVVNGTPGKAVDDFTSLLRKAAGSLPIAPLRTASVPASVLTGWLGGAPADWQVGDECELRDAGEEGGIVRCKGQDLGGDEIRTHLAAGKQVTRLAVEWQERLSCVLGDDHAVRRLRFEVAPPAPLLAGHEDFGRALYHDTLKLRLYRVRGLPDAGFTAAYSPDPDRVRAGP